MKQTSLYEMFEIEIPGDQPEAVARNCASFRQSEGEKIVVSAFRKISALWHPLRRLDLPDQGTAG